MIRQANPLASFAQGQRMGQEMKETRRKNALFDLYQNKGADIAAGDQNALAELARFDPMKARDIQQQDALFDMRGQEFQLRLAQFQRTASREEQAQAAQELENAVTIMSTAQTPEQWDALAAQYGQEQYVGRFGERQSIQAQFLSLADVLKAQEPAKPADEYGRYVQEETAAGRQPLGRLEFAQAKKGKGFTVKTPDGTEVSYGGAAGQSESPLQPSSPSAMLSTIDGILGDPALNTATGVLSFLQSVPGTPQRRFGARAAQLEGQAFLQAFESLKGGGQITEIEGQKATQAIGRMDTAQSAEDYRAALQELRGILAEGIKRPQGWVEQHRNQQILSEPFPAAEVQSFTVQQIQAMTAEDFSRIPLGEVDLTDEQWDALELRAQELEQ